MRTERLNKNTVMLFVLAAILLLIPTIAREHYFHDLAYEHMKIQSGDYDMFYYDGYVHGGRFLTVNPFDYIMMALPFLRRILPFILGILSVFLLKKILEKTRFDNTRILLILFVFVFTPIFIFSFTLNNYYSLVIFLNLLGIYLYSKSKYFFSSLCYLLLVFFGAFDFLFSIIIFYLYQINRKKARYYYVWVVFILYQIISIGVKGISLPISGFSLKNLITEFGSLTGIGIFTLILAIIGWFFYWKKNKKLLFSILVLFFVSLSFPRINYFIYPIIAILAGMGISVLVNQNWKLETLKKLTIFIFLLGMLFSILAYESRVINEMPSEKFIEGMEYLKTYDNGIVLSHPSRGLLIETFSNKTVLLDSNGEGINNLSQKKQDMNNAFHTYDLNQLRNIFDKYSIRYVVVDSEMKTRIVWEKENQEMLFLLTDERYFRKIFSNDDVDICQVLNQDN